MEIRGAARHRIVVVAPALAALAAGCGDALLSKESLREIAAVRAAVEARAEAVNEPTPTGELPILVAVRTGSPSLTAWLIERGASPVARSARGRTPLHDFVIYDRPSFGVLRRMLARGKVDVNVADDLGITPLHVAARFLQPKAADIFLRAGADPNHTDGNGRTPLHELGALLQPPDPKLSPPDPKSAAAQPAAAAATMDRLLKAGGRLDAADAQGMQPLHVYALSGNVVAARAALARGADVSAVDARGQTPLFAAAAFAHADMVSLLLAAGADVRHLDRRGLSALAAMRYTTPTPRGAPRVAAMLEAAGATEPGQPPERPRETGAPRNAAGVTATRPGPVQRDLRGERLAAQAGEVLLADTYLDDEPLRAFVGTFRAAPAAALCADVPLLQALAPELKVTRCRSARCPHGECTPAQCSGAGPPEMEEREVAIGASRRALAFFRGIPELRPGRSVESAAAIDPADGESGAVQRRFSFHGHTYALRVTDRWLPEPASQGAPRRARLELLRDGAPAVTIFETDVGDELSCTSPPWLGDVNEDGAVDVLFACQRNIHERWSGASLSVPGGTGRRLLLQRATGGVI